MKRIALLFCVAFCTLCAHAAEDYTLVITFNTGKKLEMKVSTLPEITFANDKMIITRQSGSSSSSGASSSSSKSSVSLWKVSSFTYTSSSTGISQVSSNTEMVIDGNQITVDGTHNQISAFAYDGRAIHLSPTIAGNKTVISLDGLQTGVYIIKINGKSIKFARQ